MVRPWCHRIIARAAVTGASEHGHLEDLPLPAARLPRGQVVPMPYCFGERSPGVALLDAGVSHVHMRRHSSKRSWMSCRSMSLGLHGEIVEAMHVETDMG